MTFRWLRATSLLVAAIVLAAAGSAAADPAYDRREVVDFFAKSAGDGPALGKTRSMRFANTRGICVGLESECRAKARPKGFDMLINFDLDSATLSLAARDNLREMAAALADRRLSAMRFVVEGHTDARGTDWYNEELSRRRAESVRAYLLALGIDPAKIEAAGLGERVPRVSDPYDPVNRRVEMRVSVQ
ncbi:OmpA family protein [Jiella sonneratiae]|uniref:OmpA family protein n=1 Tax=Jiella sonneratiae TaxID=2816856 RepID=A0ABS3J747_9HYPH|nr:OmpA family protein [Jiella sonneratiae]MBO0905484.1 OmpA family protein [Jiella sonneratiae]